MRRAHAVTAVTDDWLEAELEARKRVREPLLNASRFDIVSTTATRNSCSAYRSTRRVIERTLVSGPPDPSVWKADAATTEAELAIAGRELARRYEPPSAKVIDLVNVVRARTAAQELQ